MSPVFHSSAKRKCQGRSKANLSRGCWRVRHLLSRRVPPCESRRGWWPSLEAGPCATVQDAGLVPMTLACGGGWWTLASSQFPFSPVLPEHLLCIKHSAEPSWGIPPRPLELPVPFMDEDRASHSEATCSTSHAGGVRGRFNPHGQAALLTSSKGGLLSETMSTCLERSKSTSVIPARSRWGN
jgi:hypothetical protein